MSFENLLRNSEKLIQRMRDEGYSKDYIRSLMTEIRWLEVNGAGIESYEDACRIRENRSESAHMRRHYRLMYGILKRFDHDGIYPSHRSVKPLFEYGAYHRLCPEFKEVIDLFSADARVRGFEESTIGGDAANGSCFLLAMQERGASSLADITEEDVLSFFTDDAGGPALSHSYKKNIATVLSADLGELTAGALVVRSFLPPIRPKRKNVQYLKPEETSSIRAALDADSRSNLTLRDRAIGSLLYFTGLRSCDVAGLTLPMIDWEGDEINLVQDKTDVPLTLPLTAAIGNPIYDYIANGRPESDDEHVFLSLDRAHAPISAGAVYHVASKVYDAAGVRMSEGQRRGTHLFRHNAATAMVGSGVQRPVASAALGHEDPNSLDYYLSADLPHLRKCALSIEAFPVREGVFFA